MPRRSTGSHREPEVVDADSAVQEPLHSWKYLAVGPDNKLYVPVGAPCNVCDEPDFGVILRMNPDGSGTGSHCPRDAEFGWHDLAPTDRRALVYG